MDDIDVKPLQKLVVFALTSSERVDVSMLLIYIDIFAFFTAMNLSRCIFYSYYIVLGNVSIICGSTE